MRGRLILAAAALTGAAWFTLRAKDEPADEAPAPALAAEALELARPGDVVFKADGGVWGRLADSFSDDGEGYGHVGIVSAAADGALRVIHAGGDPLSREGRVQETPLTDFLGAAKIAALYRPVLAGEALDRALAFAGEAAARSAPFDSDFSLDTEDRLYCTELVWRALSAATGEDAVPRKSERRGKVYVALDDLQQSPRLKLAWRSEP